MSINFIDKISGLTPHGYYDPIRDMIIFHFISQDNKKPDIMAYLKRDMRWDVREVLSEKSILFPDKEVVEINHLPLIIYDKGSKFDKTARDILYKLEDQRALEQKDTRPIKERNKMFKILEENKYDD